MEVTQWMVAASYVKPTVVLATAISKGPLRRTRAQQEQEKGSSSIGTERGSRRAMRVSRIMVCLWSLQRRMIVMGSTNE